MEMQRSKILYTMKNEKKKQHKNVKEEKKSATRNSVKYHEMWYIAEDYISFQSTLWLYEIIQLYKICWLTMRAMITVSCCSVVSLMNANRMPEWLDEFHWSMDQPDSISRDKYSRRTMYNTQRIQTDTGREKIFCGNKRI